MARSKWPKVKDKLDLVEKWARDGLTEEQIFKNLGIGKTTGNDYKNRYPEFQSAISRGKEVFITELENALAKRALGYEYEEIKTYIKKDKDGEVVASYTEKIIKHQPANVAAASILLMNKAPDRYTRDRAALNLKREELELRKQIEEAKNW